MGLPPNQHATALLWVHNSAFRGHDTIVGDAFVVGQPGDDDDLPAPDELVQLLFHTERYQIEVQVRGTEDWRTSGLTYTNWYSAYYCAISLAQGRAEVQEVRVVAAQ